MPSELRTYDTREADYSLIAVSHLDKVGGYTGDAFANITEVYLCARDGSKVLLCRQKNPPPAAGIVVQGGALYGKASTAEEVWNSIKVLF